MKAYELLADPRKWCQGCYAANHRGFAVDPDSAEAVSWCLAGALSKCYGDNQEKYDDAYRALKRRLNLEHCLAPFNDHPQRTHAEVVAVLRELDL